jgi:hypothetical protein
VQRIDRIVSFSASLLHYSDRASAHRSLSTLYCTPPRPSVIPRPIFVHFLDSRRDACNAASHDTCTAELQVPPLKRNGTQLSRNESRLGILQLHES